MKKRIWLIPLAVLLVMSLVAIGCPEPEAQPAEPAPEGVAPEWRWRFADAFTAPARHKAHQVFIDLVEAYTDGRVQITLYPDGVLGTHREIFHAVQAGDIEIMMCFPYVDIVPGGMLNWMPWGTTSWWEADRLYAIPDGLLYPIIQDMYNEVGLQYLWGSGFGLYGLGSNVRPLITPEDLAGQKFRVSASLAHVRTLTNMGSGLDPAFTVVTLPWAEIYGALERGVVDGIWSMWPSLVEERHAEVLRYYTALDWTWDWYGIVMNKPLWDGLPADIQDAIMRASKDAQTFSMWHMQREILRFKEYAIEEMGLQVHFPTPEERALWKERANVPAIWDEFARPWLERMYPEKDMTTYLLEGKARIREELRALGK